MKELAVAVAEDHPGATRLAGITLVVLAVGWLPGLTSAGAFRAWVAMGALPLLVALANPPIPKALWAWVGLIGLTLVGAALAPWPGVAVEVALTQLGWLAAALLGNRCDPARLARWMSYAGAVAVFWSGLYGNPDFAAAFLVGTVPWTAFACRAGLVRHFLSLGLQLFALVVLDSLGAWLALAVAGIGWGLLRRGHARWLAVAGIVALGASLMWTVVQEHLLGRLYLFEIAGKIALEHPVFGVGPGGFHRAFLEGQAVVEASDLWTNATHAHHEPLQVAAEQGVLGLLLLFAPIVIALIRPRLAVGRPLGQPTTPAWVALLALTTLSLVTLPFYMPGAAWIFGLSLGAALPPAGGPVARFRRPIMLAVAVPALLLASANLLADRLLRRANDDGDLQAAATAARLALEPAPALRMTAFIQLPEDPAAAIEPIVEANRRAPSVEGHMLAGRAFMATGRYSEAIAAYSEAVRLHPRLFAGWYDLSRAYVDAGDHAAAKQAAGRAKILRPTDPRLVHLPRTD